MKSNETNILDQVLEYLKNQVKEHKGLSFTEPLLVNSSKNDGLSFRSLTLQFENAPLAIFGLITPGQSIKSFEFKQAITRRGIARKSPYLILTNLQETVLVTCPRKADENGQIRKKYPLAFLGKNLSSDELPVNEWISINGVFTQVFEDLLYLKNSGDVFLEIPDADFFVARLVRAVEILKPAVKKALISEINIKPKFAKELADWALPQGIPADLRSEGFAEAVVRQAIYRLLGKIIFYQSLRRARSALPELDLSNLDTSQVIPRLYSCFAKAHEIDYHAVFREDIIDRLPFPVAASTELRDLVEDLNTRDFAHLPQDVVGAVFERLIPPEDRHALGQFFTPETLVDLITGFCVRNAEDRVLDPTCGTGTFLIRAYDKLRTHLGVHDHSRLLGQLWGVDIAPFPAELATINLFRQRVEDTGNFPRVLNEDFFKVLTDGIYRFPPLKSDYQIPAQIDERIPKFDAIVGNFPYISADRIEQAQKGYLTKVIFPRLVEEWLQVYPEGFKFTQSNIKREFENARDKGLSLKEYLSKAEPDLSYYSDFYVYLFWHAAAFLKPGGRMGIVTSNAWLDVGFGYGLQKFFLNNFKIVAILESRCEPWFDQAAVNTIVTIVERCENSEERDTNPVRFVKIKQPLAQLIPWDIHIDSLNRWLGIQKIVHQVETVLQASDDTKQPFTWENDSLRVRCIRQRTLRKQAQLTGKTQKWGVFLRAPQTFFELFEQVKNRLVLLGKIAPPARGGTTRINDFFYVTEETINNWEIDREYCFPLIKSPGETNTILIDHSSLGMKVFICRKSKEELLASKQIGTLNYIGWGENQEYSTGVQRGMKWSEGPWVKNRKPGWYALPPSETHSSQLFFTRAYGDRHIQRYSPMPLIADARLYFLSPEIENCEIISAVLNSHIFSLFVELSGRVSMGDGALELTVEDARDYLYIPDIAQFSDYHKKEIIKGFHPLMNREIESVFVEMEKSDHQKLDEMVLEALGLESKIWLPRIYESVASLVKDRITLAKKRDQTRRARSQKAGGKVLDEVLEEILPNGLKRFPDDFYSVAAKAGGFHEIQLPSSEVRYVGHMFGKEELAPMDGNIIQVNNPFEVQFVLFAQAFGQSLVRIPNQTVECSRTVNDYKKYLRDLQRQLREAYFRRTLDQVQAERLTTEAWRKLALPVIES